MSSTTFRYHSTRVGMTRINISDMRLKSVANNLVKYKSRDIFTNEAYKATKVMTDAIEFYAQNHLVYEIQRKVHMDEPLKDLEIFVDAYHDCVTEHSVRAFYYLLLICTREARHANYSPFLRTFINKLPNGLTNFLGKVVLDEVDNVVEEFERADHTDSLGEYTLALFDNFNNGSWGHAFGGKAWARVAKCLDNFVTGVYSPEMLLDTVFTLCHNNGPIFNKGMMYTYSSATNFIKILDVQRSGQIPQYIKSDPVLRLSKVGMLLKHAENCGIVFNDYVDWFKVESLGSKHKYKSEKEMQVDKFGYPPGVNTPSVPMMKKESGNNQVFVLPGMSFNSIKMRNKYAQLIKPPSA